MISEPEPADDPVLRDVEPGGDADASPLPTPPSPATPPAAFDEKAEVHFLVDEFGIAPLDAAEMLVAKAGEAQALASEVMAEERQRDPLAGLPVPGPDKDENHIEQGADDLEKPVVHRSSAPT
jgi:hypothetical protein